MRGAEIATLIINLAASVVLSALAIRHLFRSTDFKIEGPANKVLAALLVLSGSGALIMAGLLVVRDFRESLATASVLFGGFFVVGYHFILRFFVVPKE
jgi:hypothetical protein